MVTRQPRLPFSPGVELHVGLHTCWIFAPAGRTRTILNRCPVKQWDAAERVWMVPASTAHDLAKSLRRARYSVDLIELDR